MSDRAEKRRRRRKLPRPITPIMTAIRLTEADLTTIAEATPVLDGFPGVRPWDRDQLWAAVLDASLNAKTKRERELFIKARAVLQVLDAIDRYYVNRDE
ncbi:hypothetical protein [Sorangium sp. So ce385]|uniref:hypothetical protein n=1 Tax=Sorangium sp. So ce385 TaxID=3133308 RepID=UPI003F5B8AD0